MTDIMMFFDVDVKALDSGSYRRRKPLLGSVMLTIYHYGVAAYLGPERRQLPPSLPSTFNDVLLPTLQLLSPASITIIRTNYHKHR